MRSVTGNEKGGGDSGNLGAQAVPPAEITDWGSRMRDIQDVCARCLTNQREVRYCAEHASNFPASSANAERRFSTLTPERRRGSQRNH